MRAVPRILGLLVLPLCLLHCGIEASGDLAGSPLDGVGEGGGAGQGGAGAAGQGGTNPGGAGSGGGASGKGGSAGSAGKQSGGKGGAAGSGGEQGGEGGDAGQGGESGAGGEGGGGSGAGSAGGPGGAGQAGSGGAKAGASGKGGSAGGGQGGSAGKGGSSGASGAGQGGVSGSSGQGGAGQGGAGQAGSGQGGAGQGGGGQGGAGQGGAGQAGAGAAGEGGAGTGQGGAGQAGEGGAGQAGSGQGGQVSCPDSAPPGGPSCANAVALDPMADNTAPLTRTLTGSITSQQEWFVVEMKDDPEKSTNSYHVRFALKDSPGLDLVVLRGGKCEEESVTPSVTGYDWCVNFLGNGVGHAACGFEDGKPHCDDFTAPYRVGIRRAVMGVECLPYTLEMTAAGGPCENVASTCGACAPGELRCFGSQRFECVGGKFKEMPCPAESCQETTCSGAGVCGVKNLPVGTDCGGGSVCRADGKCGCPVGSKVCGNSSISQCNDKGEFVVIESCKDGKHCKTNFTCDY